MPAKKLSPEQKADADRLKAAFVAWKARERKEGRPGTQQEAAESLGFETQSAVSQYLNGSIPLNVPALKKFCALFEVSMEAISPSIVRNARAEAEAFLGLVTEVPPAAVNPPTSGQARAGGIVNWGPMQKTTGRAQGAHKKGAKS